MTTSDSETPIQTAVYSRTESSLDPIRRYFQTVWKILSQPAVFFKTLDLSGGVAMPLTFALATHWIASAIEFLWAALIFGGQGPAMVMQMLGGSEWANFGQQAMMEWMFGAGAVIVDPFSTLLQLLLTSFVIFMAAKLLINKDDIRFDPILKVSCYALTPTLFRAVPLIGGLIAFFYGIAILVIGIQELYRTNTGKAVVVALSPKILMASAVMVLVTVAGLFAALFIGGFLELLS